MQEKHCSRCKKLQPLSQFARTKRAASGYTSQCKTCIKEYQLANKEKLKEYQRNYQPKYKAEHKEELKQYISVYLKTIGKDRHRAYVDKWRADHPEKVKEYIRISNARAKLKRQMNDQ